MIEWYRARVSGTLLDRIDLHFEVPAVTLSELQGPEAESSAPPSAPLPEPIPETERSLLC